MSEVEQGFQRIIFMENPFKWRHYKSVCMQPGTTAISQKCFLARVRLPFEGAELILSIAVFWGTIVCIRGRRWRRNTHRWDSWKT